MSRGGRDLHVLVADGDMYQTLEGVLSRPESLGVRPINYTIDQHVDHDPGCRAACASHLRSLLETHEHALVVFDQDGCGREGLPREAIQAEVEADLRRSGWEDRAKAVVIDPELEAWVWGPSAEVARMLHWPSYRELKSWLEGRELWPPDAAKPPDPKAAMRAALREKRIRASATVFRGLADTVSLRHCQCPAFGELTKTLIRWFPVQHA